MIAKLQLLIAMLLLIKEKRLRNKEKRLRNKEKRLRNDFFELRNLISCSIPDDHIDPRRSAFFMARSVLSDIREGVQC